MSGLTVGVPGDWLDVVHAHLPGLAVDRLDVHDEGWDHWVVVVNRAWVFRFARRPGVAKRLCIEQRVLNHIDDRVLKAGVRVPRPSPVRDARGRVIGSRYPFISGEPLRAALLDGVDASTTDRIAEHLGSFLTILHDADVSAFQTQGVPALQAESFWQQDWREIQDRVLPLLDCDERRAVLARFADFFDQAVSGTLPQALLHGDLTHAHILYDPCVTEAIGIIDFGDVQIGDPAYDFAGLYWDYGPAFVQNVLDHYAAGQGKWDVHAFRARVEYLGLRVGLRELLHAVEHHHTRRMREIRAELRASLSLL
ncbi:phosphotransferase family protein [Alicyclobacillus mali (ex Roth et al. 2021)]|uniref:phosphotransferase family protein n=1 Tax=Alicyclobacillus mali (ex Roth et al. 2021) TaxID=1123961 RepID=UPI0032421C5D